MFAHFVTVASLDSPAGGDLSVQSILPFGCCNWIFFLIPLVEIEVVEKEIQTPQIVTQEISPIQDFPVESYPDFSQESVSKVVVAEKPFDWNVLFFGQFMDWLR